MLLKCPECELPVSDKAISCPHCGNPMKQTSHSPSRTSKKRMRLPNGFGQITELKDRNLRKPFRVMVTVGKNAYGRPICKLLQPHAFFETYNEAYMALVEYNKNPYELETSITVKELYDKWTNDYFLNIAESSKRTINAAWAYCKPLYDMNVKLIRVGHIKGVIKDCESQNIKNRIKSLFNLMLDYAIEYGIVDKNYARDFKIERADVIKGHKVFTDEEMETLWNKTSIPFVNIILLQCYTGWRPQELCLIKRKDCDVDEFTITGGMKTEAGKNRTVPVCTAIKEVFLKVFWISTSLGCDNLICRLDGTPYTYDMYYKDFKKQMAIYEMNHSPHDPRKQFITMLKNKGADEYAIKYLCGHAIDDLTEKIYTERSIDWLRENADLLEK